MEKTKLLIEKKETLKTKWLEETVESRQDMWKY